MPARVERVTFRGSQGTDLAARLDLPAAPPRAYALFAHCFTCTKEAVAASRIAAELTVAGIGVLRFDFTGLGAATESLPTRTSLRTPRTSASRQIGCG